MIKLALTTAVAVVAFSASAFAGSAKWNATEISTSGIKSSSGTWTVVTEGDKVSGKGDMQLDSGSVLTYKLEGSVAGGVYTLKLVDRSDAKKDCVWTGKPNDTGRVLNGEVACEGSKFSIRAGLQ